MQEDVKIRVGQRLKNFGAMKMMSISSGVKREFYEKW